MRGRIARAVGALALLGLVAGCGSGGSGRAQPATGRTGASTPTTASTVVGTAPPTAPPTTPPPTAPAAFSSSVGPVTAADLGASWHDGCPVGPDQLRRVTLTYRDFDGRVQTGALVVNADAVDAVQAIFHRLFDQQVPIRSMQPVDRFGGSDDASMAADNTSAFNCRLAVTTGPAQWSAHAYGRAIDVNPVENPYVLSGSVLPPAGAPYTDRTDVRPGMAVAGAALVDAFAQSGWQWGGRWAGSPDWQHFSADGS